MTLAYVHGPSTVPLIGETIGAVLNDMAERYGQAAIATFRLQRERRKTT